MWEYCLCFDNQLESKIFVEKIKPFIRKIKGVVVSIFLQDTHKVLVAVPIEKKEYTTNFLKENLAEIILTNYKKDYILSRLSFEVNHSINMNVFLQTLVCFDSDMDKQIILESLNFDKSIYFGSFINFRLKFLKNKWDELITLANDNIMYLLSEDSFVELIKFLISNLDYRCYAVNVFSKKNCYLLCDMEGKVIKDFLLDKNIVYDDNKLLTSLIALNPEKIIIHCGTILKENLLKNLYNFFSNRIEICK